MAKLDAQGAVLWARQITGFRSESVNGVAVDAAGNVSIAGTLQHDAIFDDVTMLQGASVVSRDLFVARYDANGTVLWARSFGGPTDDVDSMIGNGIAVDAAGNVYVAGGLKGEATVGTTTLNNTALEHVPVLLKLTSDGNVAWVRQGQLVGNALTSPYGGASAVAVDATGNAVLCGSFNGSLNLEGVSLQTVSTQSQMFVARFDATGNLQWARESIGSTKVQPNAVGIDAAGNTYVAGVYEGATAFGSLALTTSGQTNGYLVKFDPSGSAQWARTVGSSQYTAINGLALTPSGDTYVTGQFAGSALLDAATTLNSQGNSDILVASYNTQGNLRWAQQAGGPSSDIGTSVGVDATGQVYVSGMIAGPVTFGTHILSGPLMPFVAKLGMQPLATAAATTLRSLTFNPNPATEIVFLPSLPVGTQVMITDALGRSIRKSVTIASVASTQVSIAGLAPGTYLLRATDPKGLQYGGRLVVQ
ncbi:SBBP repeat-containing protein [Hymenobacter sp. YC55]|uniref:SBBP repeat-containing protein n=1 Tax=Hymenobacter sp. YC55 TaxID=3034019 RepID=UPI0023F79BDA|nr:SBBP repeat-containing protein [Hymenobacter sp. YC55]